MCVRVSGWAVSTDGGLPQAPTNSFFQPPCFEYRRTKICKNCGIHSWGLHIPGRTHGCTPCLYPKTWRRVLSYVLGRKHEKVLSALQSLAAVRLKVSHSPASPSTWFCTATIWKKNKPHQSSFDTSSPVMWSWFFTSEFLFTVGSKSDMKADFMGSADHGGFRWKLLGAQLLPTLKSSSSELPVCAHRLCNIPCMLFCTFTPLCRGWCLCFVVSVKHVHRVICGC